MVHLLNSINISRCHLHRLHHRLLHHRLLHHRLLHHRLLHHGLLHRLLRLYLRLYRGLIYLLNLLILFLLYLLSFRHFLFFFFLIFLFFLFGITIGCAHSFIVFFIMNFQSCCIFSIMFNIDMNKSLLLGHPFN